MCTYRRGQAAYETAFPALLVLPACDPPAWGLGASGSAVHVERPHVHRGTRGTKAPCRGVTGREQVVAQLPVWAAATCH